MSLQSILTYFESNPLVSYITTGAVGGVLGGLVLLGIQTILKQGIAYHFKKKLQEMKHEHDKKLKDFNHDYDEKLRDLNHQYDKRLASFNEQITIDAELRKLDFDRKIHDFSIYSVKRYEVYPDLFKRIYRTQVTLWHRKSLFPIPSDITSIKDVIELVEDANISLQEETISQLDELLTQYETVKVRNKDKKENLNKILNDILEVMSRLIYIDCTEYLVKQQDQLVDFYTENVLYLSEEVSSKGWEAVKKLGEAIRTKDSTDENLISDLNRTVEELQAILKQELSVGDYSNKA